MSKISIECDEFGYKKLLLSLLKVLMTVMIHLSLYFRDVIGDRWGNYIFKQNAAGLLTEPMPISQKYKSHDKCKPVLNAFKPALELGVNCVIGFFSSVSI